MSKERKKKIVPGFRFPEFSNQPEWSEITLGEISERIEEKVGDMQLTTVSITAGNGFVSQAEKFSRDISGQQYKNYIVLNEGDFAYNKGNSKKYPQGCICKLKEFKKVATPNSFICFRFKTNYIAEFYLGYFDNNYHGKQLQKFITSGARMDGLLNISPGDFFSIVLPTPKDRKEQQKIAACLSSFDDLVAAHTQKLDALKAHKKGLMQQLFPTEGEYVPKLRFKQKNGHSYPIWEEVKLSTIAKLVTQKNKNEKVRRVLTNSATLGVMDQRDYFEKDIANKSNLSGYYIVKLGDYVYNPRISLNAPVGPISKNQIGIGVMSPLYLIFTFDNIENDFYEQYFQTSHWHKYLRSISNSGARHDRMSLSNNDFMRMPILYPHPEEQQKIADCLSSIANLIGAQSQKIEELKAHKKGLMQNLFPSFNDSEE
jgi:type I restriction enzyme S subunit